MLSELQLAPTPRLAWLRAGPDLVVPRGAASELPGTIWRYNTVITLSWYGITL